MAFDLSGLNRFGKVLEQTKENLKGNKENSFIGQKIKIAKETIQEAYDSVSHVKVVVEKKDNTHYSIKAVDKQDRPTIAFDEFGTGFYAKGSYKGKLPTQKITFKTGVKGKVRSTYGWEYYYQPSSAKITHGGIKGWMFGKTFSIGENASNRMYTACKLARARLRGKK